MIQKPSVEGEDQLANIIEELLMEHNTRNMAKQLYSDMCFEDWNSGRSLQVHENSLI